MPQDDRPLLARADSRDSYREANEEDALLTGQPTGKTQPSLWTRYREAGITIYALLATIAIVVLAIVVDHESRLAHSDGPGAGWGRDGKPTGKRNLIFMVSDGMGPTSLEMTRSFRQFTESLPDDDILVLDQHLVGVSRSKSSNSFITDSAAGATAFSCGKKSYNEAISVLPDRTPCGTVLEAAKQAGYMTGLVVTTDITDATPACFASHAINRSYQDLIAEQLIGDHPLGSVVDVLIGGGRCHFLPNTTSGSCRHDSVDLVKKAQKKYGFNYIDNRKDFDNLDAEGGIELPLLALLSDRDIPFEIDRVKVSDIYPSQYDMAKLAIAALEAATVDSDKGFFLMIEGSRIDHAGHINDPAAQVHEVLVHDKTFSHVLDFFDKSETPGVLISTSDHETGGLAAGLQQGLAYPEYQWYPGVLANASHSALYLGGKYATYLNSKPGQKASYQDKINYIRHSLLEEEFGLYDVTDTEIGTVINATIFYPPYYILGRIISQRANIGWSTHGHTAVDVNVYASDPHHARALIGHNENTDVGKFLADFLEVDVDAVTKVLIEKGIRTTPRTGGPSDSSTTNTYEEAMNQLSSSSWEDFVRGSWREDSSLNELLIRGGRI